jgi:hypothetical protein
LCWFCCPSCGSCDGPHLLPSLVSSIHACIRVYQWACGTLTALQRGQMRIKI